MSRIFDNIGHQLNLAPKKRDPLIEAMKADFVARGLHTVCPGPGEGQGANDRPDGSQWGYGIGKFTHRPHRPKRPSPEHLAFHAHWYRQQEQAA